MGRKDPKVPAGVTFPHPGTDRDVGLPADPVTVVVKSERCDMIGTARVILHAEGQGGPHRVVGANGPDRSGPVKVVTPLRLVLRVCSAGRCPVCERQLYPVGDTLVRGGLEGLQMLLCSAGCSAVRPQRARRRLPGLSES